MGDEYKGRVPGKSAGIFRHLKTYLHRSRLGELLVIKGLITPRQLRDALHKQKQTAQPLGQIFLESSIISRRQLVILLGRQWALRALTAAVFCMASLGLSSKKARADLMDVPAKIAISTQVNQAGFAVPASYPALFGTDEKRSRNLKPFTKWTGMFSRFDRELKNGDNMELIHEWQDDLYALRNLSLKRMAGKVNDLVNRKKYIVDSKNFGKSDYWATPVEFLKYGGDCEDFAIAKYTALRSLGVPEERMRVAIVHDNYKNIPHAVLVVYTDQGTYILDNQNDRMLDGDRPGRYRPIFSINRQAWWLHTSPSATIVASAN